MGWFMVDGNNLFIYDFYLHPRLNVYGFLIFQLTLDEGKTRGWMGNFPVSFHFEERLSTFAADNMKYFPTLQHKLLTAINCACKYRFISNQTLNQIINLWNEKKNGNLLLFFSISSSFFSLTRLLARSLAFFDSRLHV